MIWRIRLYIARWLLSGAPQGVELYFRKNRVLERSRAVKSVVGGFPSLPRGERLHNHITVHEDKSVLAEDWSEVLEEAQ